MEPSFGARSRDCCASRLYVARDVTGVQIIKRKFRVRAEKYHMTGGTGSLRYMAPEIADHQEYNEKGDVYSFSLIMWEMLAGTKPFLGELFFSCFLV